VRRDENSGTARGGPLPPLLVFVALMSVLVAVGAVVLVTRNDPPPPPRPTTTPSPDFSLTDAEAIARFKELRALRDQMYRDRDLSLLSELYAPASPLIALVTTEIRRLLHDDVLYRSRYRTQRIAVTENMPTRITLLEVVHRHPRFVSEAGTNVTKSASELLQRAKWILVEIRGRWLVQQSKIVKSRKVHE
jgi:hypothetical protein